MDRVKVYLNTRAMIIANFKFWFKWKNLRPPTAPSMNKIDVLMELLLHQPKS